MRPYLAHILAALATSLIAACDPMPTFEVSEGARNASYPELIPAEDILATVSPDAITPQTSNDLAERSARLRARAQRLKGSVVDAETQERLKSGVN